jgi:hypothetical protein
MTQVNYGEKLKKYAKRSFISFFRQGLAKDAKRNREWLVFINASDPEDNRTYWQGFSHFKKNYPCGILIDFEWGSENRKHYLKDLQFAVLKGVDGANRMAFYHYSEWSEMY